MNQTNNIISLSKLWFSYNGPESTILRDFSLNVPACTITAVLGPNGAGKTTLMHLILGILSPQSGSGTIMLNARLQGSYSRRALSQLIGLVPQDEYIPFDFSVLEYVQLGRAPHLGALGTPREIDCQIALAALRTTGLADLQHRPIPTLSGGERQLAILARALAQQPQILLMDEPTAHLDLNNKGKLLQIMRDLVAQEMTILFTTHDPAVAAEIASYVILMRREQPPMVGPIAQVLTSEKLTATYQTPVEVIRVQNRLVVLSQQIQMD